MLIISICLIINAQSLSAHGKPWKSYEEIIESEGKFIAGVAVDQNRAPIADVYVQICCHKIPREDGRFTWSYSSEHDALNATTDAQGRFAIELEESGFYNLCFSSKNYAAIIAYDIPVGKKDLTAVLPEGGKVSGCVVRIENGQKIAAASAEVKAEQVNRASYSYLGFNNDKKTLTNSHGRFEFEHLRIKERDIGRGYDKWKYMPRKWKISSGKASRIVTFDRNMIIDSLELVIEDANKPAVQVEGENVQAIQKRKDSAKRLRDLGKLLFIYTNDHEGRYPGKLEEIQQQPYSPADLKSWFLENVEYRGSGKTASTSPRSPIVYDQSLLRADIGTNVLFNSGRVEFVKASQLEELGITVKTEKDGEFVKDATQEARKVTDFLYILRVIDVNGNPVEGVGVHKYFSISEDARRSHGRFISDEEGFVKFQHEDIFEYSHEEGGILLYAVSENRLAGFLEITPQHMGKPIQWQLKTACKVYGELKSQTLEKLNQLLEWTNIYLYRDRYRPLSCSSKKGQYEFLLPPGHYRLHAYGRSTYFSDQDIEINVGQKELKIDFDLPADKLATLVGKPAPELREVKGWLNSKPLKLSELRGKVVLLDFWGYWCGPCIGGIPKLVELYEKFSKDGLTIIAIHDDSLNSIQELKNKLKEISAERWDGKSIPFPIALDGGGESKIEGTNKSARGATTAAYGIQGWPTYVLIDRSGNIIKRFHPRNPDGLNELERALYKR